METTAPPGRESERVLAERLAYLKAHWTSPQRLRTHHKAEIRTIKSLEQGFDGTVARCCFCHELGKCDTDLHVHHIDHDISNNDLKNVDVAHVKCNTGENARYAATQRALATQRLGDRSSVCAREQTSGSHPDQQTSSNERSVTEEGSKWSGKEGVKHDAQRFVWNKWLTDLEKGPFKGINTKLYPGALAEMAPWGLGRYAGMEGPLGSSVTYRRFIREDKAGAILGQDVDEVGKEVVFLNYKPETEKVN